MEEYILVSDISDIWHNITLSHRYCIVPSSRHKYISRYLLVVYSTLHVPAAGYCIMCIRLSRLLASQVDVSL